MDLSIDCCQKSCEYWNEDFKNNCEQNQTDFLERCENYCSEAVPNSINFMKRNSDCYDQYGEYCEQEKQKHLMEMKELNEGMKETVKKLEELKETEGKTHWKYFPFEECEEVVKAFEYGVKKYGGPFTYRKGIDPLDLMEAAMRHLIEIQKGNILDHESGLNHFAHVAASALMALSQYKIKLDHPQKNQKKEEL